MCISLSAPIDAAGIKQDIGYTALAEELGAAMPDGRDVAVTLVEATVSIDDQDAWLPDPAAPELAGKNLVDVSGLPTGLFSGHATTTARHLFGSVTSIAPGIPTAYIVEANSWLGSDSLQVDSPGRPRQTSGRVGNHSWIGSLEEQDGEALRRLDWLIGSGESVHVVGLSNGQDNPPLLGGAYNVIAVGVTDGEHGPGTAAVDAVYTGDRSRPHIVVPEETTSVATPTVAAAIALLVETGQAQPGLSTDPVSQWVDTASYGAVYNASRSEVLKAVIMASASRRTANSSDTDIIDYRVSPSDRAPNGLDRRYGAGQLNVLQAYQILSAGEQNSAEDDPSMGGAVGPSGFDYDPAFGGADGSNLQARYRLPVPSEDADLTVALVWNLPIDSGADGAFDSSATQLDIDLQLLDVTGGGDGVEVARSAAGVDYNSEHLWLEVQAGRTYEIKVLRGAGQDGFAHDFALAWQLREATDTDEDGVPDREDNCIAITNPGQGDADQDGFGNLCDADIDNDALVNFGDLAVLKSAFGTANALADLDGNGFVNFRDLAILKSRFGKAPGPSGLAP